MKEKKHKTKTYHDCDRFCFGSPSWTRTNDTISCGARRKTSLKRRFSVDRCAILPSLLLPPAALGHDAVNSLRLFVQAAIDRIQFERKK